ncbi:MAG: T9SS type A sorting domain-containing protein [Calditrichaeota bacterium]|nr:T9SS type A sorting domain-containing protein [Calditrichota bacterium]
MNDIDGYNTFAVLWTPDWYIFYVNGVFTFIATRGVSHVDEYIILSEEPYFWNDLPDSVRNGAVVQDTFRVDYVRVYQKKSSTLVNNNKKSVENFALEQNYPNPFNPFTTIPYSIPADNFVTLKVYDVMGQEVSTLVNEFKKTGAYTISFDATNLPSGVYYYKLVSGRSFSKMNKMLLMR